MQADYVMRMIQQFVHALVAIIQCRKNGKPDEALEEIQLASHKYLECDISFFLGFTPDQLVEHFRGDSDKSIMCADLLYQLALISDDKKCLNESRCLKTMALNLYLTVLPSSSDFQTISYKNKINELLSEIDVRALTKKMQENLLNYQGFLKKA